MEGKNRKIRRALYHLRTQGTGSEGIHIRGMVSAFRQSGYTVDFIWPLGKGDPTKRAGDNPYAREKRRSVLESIVPLIPGFIFAFIEYCYNFWAYRKIRSALKKNTYDFIYERHFFFSRASGLLSKRFNIPLVVEINELSGFERVRGHHLKWLAQRCEHSLFSNATVISVVSTFLRNAIIERYPDIDNKKIQIIPNGVDNFFLSQKTDGGAIRDELGIRDKYVFGFVGFFLHVTSWHALEWFVPAFIEAVRDDPDVVLLLVGDGPGRSTLEEIGRRMDFEDRLIFTGAVPNSKISNYLQAMDIGVIPHSNEYRSPIKLFEYMARGKPVLAPDQEPIESIIGKIQGDYLFKAKSRSSLKNAISRILDDRENWPVLAKKLEKLLRTDFTYEKHGETIINFIEQYENQR